MCRVEQQLPYFSVTCFRLDAEPVTKGRILKSSILQAKVNVFSGIPAYN
jgi:hypothetical protein